MYLTYGDLYLGQESVPELNYIGIRTKIIKISRVISSVDGNPDQSTVIDGLTGSNILKMLFMCFQKLFRGIVVLYKDYCIIQ